MLCGLYLKHALLRCQIVEVPGLAVEFEMLAVEGGENGVTAEHTPLSSITQVTELDVKAEPPGVKRRNTSIIAQISQIEDQPQTQQHISRTARIHQNVPKPRESR